MKGWYTIDENGKHQPATIDEYSAWDVGGKRQIARDELADGVTVSTVFLGLDHQFGNGPPLLYETMIFGGPHDQWQDRYTSRKDAERGHRAAVRMAREGQR